MYWLPFCSGAKTHLGVGDVGDELSEGSHIRCWLKIVALGWHSVRRFEKITLSDDIELLQFGNEGIRGLRKGARRSEQATYYHRIVFHEGSPEFRTNDITKGRKGNALPPSDGFTRLASTLLRIRGSVRPLARVPPKPAGIPSWPEDSPPRLYR
jgi:hypothetical protein